MSEYIDREWLVAELTAIIEDFKDEHSFSTDLRLRLYLIFFPML